MPFLPSPKVKWFAIISLLAVGFFAYGQHAIAQDGTVQTYTNQAIPSDVPPQYDRYSSPVKAGQLTLEDVLAAHPKQKPALLPPVVGGTVTATSPTTPLLAPTSGASSQNIMLMQGMKTVLQQGDTNTPTRLKAPQMQGAGGVAGQPLSAAASVSTTPVNVSTAPGVVFEPGQAPKNLATGAVISTAAPKTTVSGVQSVAAPSYAPETVPAPMATTATAAATTTGAKTMNGCEEHTQSWTKTCAEAGYPSNFNGKITGETRTTCPEGSLQDVWIANSCAPPEEGASASYAPNPPATATTGLSNTAAEQQALTNAAAETTMPATAALPPPAPPAGSLAPSVVSQTMIPNVRTDANCGSANGMATNARPIADLCSAGEVSEVSGEGPWRWTCKGIQGGMTVSCAAPVSANAVIAPPSSSSSSSSAAIVSGVAASPTAEDGTCGTSDGAGTDHMPGANLCAHGVASRVSGNGPWTWACSGFNGGSAAACTAPKKADGACGSSTRVGSDQMPTNDLCSAGYASAVTGDGPWNWTCSGVYGGAAAMCSAAPKRDAVCGSASLTG
ncbi:MAG TPA: hypothetical protein VFR09_06675, partial [Alphaproteobacteria bacterium]|nr:hypothetical protein [Alphaproteobacteria bacterium]